MSAIVLLVLIETGICIDRNRVVTITELNLWTALTQADGFRRFENPPCYVTVGTSARLEQDVTSPNDKTNKGSHVWFPSDKSNWDLYSY